MSMSKIISCSDEPIVSGEYLLQLDCKHTAFSEHKLPVGTLFFCHACDVLAAVAPSEGEYIEHNMMEVEDEVAEANDRTGHRVLILTVAFLFVICAAWLWFTYLR